MPGLPELLIILLLAIVVFGANKLAGVGKALGQSIREYKTAVKGEEADDSAQEL